MDFPNFDKNIDLILGFLYDSKEEDENGYIEISRFLVEKKIHSDGSMASIVSSHASGQYPWLNFSPKYELGFGGNPATNPEKQLIRARLTQEGREEVIRRRTIAAELSLRQKQNDSFDKVVQSSIDSASAAKASAETAKSASRSGLVVNIIIAVIALVSSVSTCHMAFKDSDSQSASTSVSDSSDTKNKQSLKKEQESIVTTTNQASHSTTTADSAQVRAPKTEPEKKKNDEG